MSRNAFHQYNVRLAYDILIGILGEMITVVLLRKPRSATVMADILDVCNHQTSGRGGLAPRPSPFLPVTQDRHQQLANE